jgi:drug/metabolite transporter (DMT)-like permease
VRERLRGTLILCLAMLLWPLVEAFASILSRPYSPIEIVWVRYGVHLLLMLVLWTPGGPARLVKTRRPGLQVIRGLTMLGLPACFVFAIARMRVEAAMSLFWIAPLLAMLAAWWLGERPGRRRWMAAIGAYVGVLLMLGPFAVTLRRAAVLPLLMATCFALYLVLTRLMRDETTASRLFYTALSVWVPLGLVVPWVWTTPTLRDFAIMASIGILGFLFLLGLDRALDAEPVGRLAPFVLAQPIWTVVTDAVLSGHAPARHAVVGVVVVLGAWLVFAWPDLGHHSPARRASSTSP